VVVVYFKALQNFCKFLGERGYVCCEPTNVLFSFSFMHPATVGVRCKYNESLLSPAMSLLPMSLEFNLY